MRQVTENLGLDLGGITDEPSLIPNQVTNMIKLDQAIGQGGKDDVARAAAATAQETAEQAAEDATAAEALAQQAIAAGMKLKVLSEDEITTALTFTAGTDGFLRSANVSESSGYVINITPRYKIIYIRRSYEEKTIAGTANKTLIMRHMSSSINPNWSTYSFSIIPTFGKVTTLLEEGSLKAITETSSTPLIRTSFYVNLVGILIYNQDVDLGTDIV